MRGAPPILWTATGFAAGAAAGTAPGFDRTLLPLLILALPIALWRGPLSRAFLVLLCFAAGLAWGTADRRVRDACTSAVRDGSEATVTGYFTRASAEGASTLRVNEGARGGCGGPVRVYTRGEEPPEARPVTVAGRWFRSERPDGSVAVYLSASSVREPEGPHPPVPWTDRVRSSIRGRASEALERRLGAQAGVASALVLAERDGIPRELWDAFARSGSAHLLSISGFHVGVIAALLGGLIAMTGRPPRTRAAGMAIGVWAYVLLIGAPTSATRAAWMTTAFVLGRLRQTPARALGALGLSMLMIALVRPSVVAGAGFQLTVAGTAGILTMTRWILRHWPAHRGRGWIASPVAAGLGASVFTAPVLAYHFGQVPLLSLPSSIALTPLVAAAVPGVIVTIVMDVLHLPGAALAGAGSEGLLHMVTAAAAALGAIPGTVAPVTPREAALLTAGALLPLLLAGGARWRIRPAVRAGVAALSALAVLWAGQAALSLTGRGTLRIVAIDVGQGDAIALRTPRGRWLLVDAGPRGFGGSDAGLTRVVPYLHGQGARRLEAVVLTHPDEDHAGGLASVLRHVPAGAVLGPGLSGGQSGHMDGAAEARRARIPWRRAAAGDAWTVDGVGFEVLSPAPGGPTGHSAASSPNDWSVVLRVSYGAFSALLMGDADAAVESRLLDQGPVTLLKVGHHGSRTSTSEDFVRAVSPGYALIPVGARNRYGHPDPAVLARLARAGAHVYRTDRDGTVTLTARGDGSVTVRGSRRRPRGPAAGSG
ncbi:MAG: DNA internalization-related competence protein ComEC/Rec2 [Gemmatimonadota bacterium]|nr:DNA internalization-related competence protein ComEC/Rec2 [Gemmatimonadota bacterium]MDE2872498.1 DNA internalization-related competence protein ComEC/Rec2 [Gemmatimonadota bacterium]